mmetsp:Transcript_27510/g.36062  ORF Transcript_27510/g.36062 Transcript_27510/m.36062 type:complete len:384 (+) Transcript_27510:143-1294(+)
MSFNKDEDDRFDLNAIMKQGKSALKGIQQDIEEKEQEKFVAEQKQLLASMKESASAKGDINGDGMTDEEFARKLQEEEDRARTIQQQDLQGEEELAALIQNESAEMDDDEEARFQQMLWESMLTQDAIDDDGGVAEGKGGDEEETGTGGKEGADGKEDQMAKDAELQAKLAAEEEDALMAAELQAKMAAEEEADEYAVKLQHQEARRSHREAAREKLMAEVSKEEEGDNEAEKISAQVRLWKDPKTYFTEVAEGFQIAVYLPAVIKINVPLDEEKKGIFIMAERLPIAYDDSLELEKELKKENPITCQTMLHVNVGRTPGLLSSKDVSFEYSSEDQILYIYITHAGISQLSIDKKEDLFQGMKGGIKRIFNFRGKKGTSSMKK